MKALLQIAKKKPTYLSSKNFSFRYIIIEAGNVNTTLYRIHENVSTSTYWNTIYNSTLMRYAAMRTFDVTSEKKRLTGCVIIRFSKEITA